MPLAVPLGREKFVQYLRTDPLAPRQEPARVHEVKGQRRHGTGVAYRLFGPHAVVWGTWTNDPMTDLEQTNYASSTQEGERHNGWGRPIRLDEMDLVANHVMKEKFRLGWRPPIWHWRFYWDRAVIRLAPLHVVNYNAYGHTSVHVGSAARYWLREGWTRLRIRLQLARGVEPGDGRVEGWSPMVVVSDDEDE